MGALNKEYIYKMLAEDDELKNLENRQAFQNTLYNKFFLSPLINYSAKFGKQGKYIGAFASSYIPLLAKTSITGNQQHAAWIAQHMPFQALQDPNLIQALGITPYILLQMSSVQNNISTIRNIDSKFLDNSDFAKYGRMASFTHAYSNISKIVPTLTASLAGLSALSGAGGLASSLAHFNPLSGATFLAKGLSGGLAALTGLNIPSMLFTIPLFIGLSNFAQEFAKLGKKAQSRRIPMSPTVPGATLLYSQSTYNQHVNQIMLLQSQGLLSPKDTLMLSILNDINLNTAPLRIEFTQKQLGEKQFQNNIARNRLLDLYDPQEERLNAGILTDDDIDTISAKELQKRKASYHLNTTISLLHSLGLTALTGPFATLLTGKNYNKTRKDIFDILYGNNRLRAQAHEEAAKRLNLPGDLMTALYTPVTKWLNYETPEMQQLAILANIHELVRSAALSLVSVNKVLGGDKFKTGNIYSLIQDLEEEYLNRGKEIEDLEGIDALFGPIWSKPIKALGGLLGYGWKGTKLLGRGLIAPGEIFTRIALDTISPRKGKSRVESYFDQLGNGLINLITTPGEKLKAGFAKTKNFLFADVKDFFQKGFLPEALRKRLGYISKKEIDKEFEKILKEEKSYNKKESAFTFLSDYFPDLTMQILEELQQQTQYLADMLDCWNCQRTDKKRSAARWRGSEGTFLTDKEYAERINSKTLDKLKEKLGYNDLKNMAFGKISKFFYNKVFGIKEEEFHELAKYMDEELIKKKGLSGITNLLTFTRSKTKGKYAGPVSSINLGAGIFYPEIAEESKTLTVNDDQLQKQLKKKKIFEDFLARDKLKTKNLNLIKKNTDYNKKIYELLKNGLPSTINNKKDDNTDMGFLFGLGLWEIIRKIKDWYKRRKFESRKPKLNERKRLPEEERKRLPEEERKRLPEEERKRLPLPEEEYKTKTKAPIEIEPKENLPSTKKGEILEKVLRKSGKKRGFAKFIEILAEKFEKRGLKHIFLKFLKRVTITTATAAALTGVTGTLSDWIGALIDGVDTAVFVLDYWDIFKEAWEEYKAEEKVMKMAKREERINKFIKRYYSGHATKKEFDRMLNSVPKHREIFRGLYHGRVGHYVNNIDFKESYLKDYLDFKTRDLEKIYYYGKKFHEFRSEDDKIKFYQFLQFKKFIENHKLEDKFKYATNDDIQKAFDEFVHHQSQFIKDYVGTMETGLHINIKLLEILQESFLMLRQIALADLKSSKYLENISSKIEFVGVKTISAVAK